MLYPAHLVAPVATALVSLSVARWVSTRTRDRSGTVMIALLVLNAAIAVFGVAQLLSPSLPLKILWNTLWFTLVLTVPVAWLLLAVYYTGREYWLSRPVWALLAAMVVVPGGLMLTNPFHELLVTDYRMVSEPFAHMTATPTGRFHLLFPLVHLNVVASVGLFLEMFLFSRRTTRWQTAAILVGMAAIFVPAAATAAGQTPLATYPYGVFGSTLFAVLVAVALFRTRMFAVAPLARDALFESLDEAILVLDARLTVVDYNDTAAALFPGLDESLGEHLDAAYPEFVTDGGPETGPPERRATVVDRSVFAETVDRAAEDGSRTFRVSVSEIKSGGEPRGYALVLRDVTELERKTEQLERFASVLSHDLRNPVSVAAGNAELALETGETEHVRKVVTSIERIEETIDDLLALAREGDAIDEVAVVSLREVVEQAWTTTETRDGTLQNEIDPTVRIEADESRLRTLFENLFRNSAEHGGGTVSVESTAEGFAVADDGPGIPEAEREAVFEFGHSGADGTGFGLAIARSVAEGHGWELGYEASTGSGARFVVSGVEFVTESSTVAEDDER